MRTSREFVADVLPRPTRLDASAVLDYVRPHLELAGILVFVAIFWGILLYGAATYALP